MIDYKKHAETLMDSSLINSCNAIAHEMHLVGSGEGDDKSQGIIQSYLVDISVALLIIIETGYNSKGVARGVDAAGAVLNKFGLTTEEAIGKLKGTK